MERGQAADGGWLFGAYLIAQPQGNLFKNPARLLKKRQKLLTIFTYILHPLCRLFSILDRRA